MTLVTRRSLLTAAGAGFLAAGSGVAYAGLIEPAMLRVTTYELTPPAWPADFALDVAVVADVHACEPFVPMSRVTRIVETVNALKPDLIVHLGDHEATHHFVVARVPPREWAAAYADLSAPLGLYTILGNHDWWHNLREIRDALDHARIRVMENEAELLDHRGRRFWLAGLGDQIAHWLGRPGHFAGEDDLPGTLAQVTTDDPVLLLAHEPDVFPQVPARVSLTLAGHTHGGQVHVPGFVNPWIPSRYRGRYRYGHVVEEGRHMIVSGGIGMSVLPVRVGAPPEIVSVRLGRRTPGV